MSFWDLSDDKSAADTGKEFDGGGGSMEPIPDGSSVLAMPDEAKWDTDKENNEFLSIRWTVVKPEQFLNRKVFQKLWLSDDDPKAKDPVKKRDKAKRMFAAIDANAGGKLLKKQSKPTDDELALALTNKMMVIRVHVWEMEGDKGAMSGNWVAAVSAKDKELRIGASASPKAQARTNMPSRQAPAFDSDLDDDVPF